MASALDKLTSGKETQKKFSGTNEDSLYINTDDLFSSGNKFSFDDGASAQETQTDERTYKNALDKLTEESNKYLDEEQYEESTTFARSAINVIKDIAVQPFGGVVDAAESIVNLALPEEREIEISDWVPESKSAVGRFIRPASQFFIPYTGAFKIAKGGYLFVKNAGRLKKFVSSAEKSNKAIIKLDKGKKVIAQGGGKTTVFKPLEKLTSAKQAFGLGIGAGALTDGVAFAPTDGNLADLFVQYPATKNAVTEWLQTDPNGDPGMERLKNSLTGIVPGIVIPTVLKGVAKGFSWTSKPVRSKLSKTADDLEIAEELEINLKKNRLGDDIETSAIRKLVAKKRTGYQKVAMLFREQNATKRRVIKYLDGIRGVKYLMDAATKIGVKGLTGKNKIGAYKENRFLPAIGGMVEHFLIKNTFKFKDGLFQTTGNDGLQNLLAKNLGKNADMDKFFDYMGAKSLLSLDDDKFKGLFKDSAKARKEFINIAKQGDAKEAYVKTLKEMDRFNSELLDFAVDTQMITATQKTLFLKNRKHFLPLYRDLSDTELLFKRTGGNKLRVPFKASVPVGTGKGELPFSNFFDNYVENVQSIISTGYKNHAKRATFDIIDSAKAQGKGMDAWAKKLEGKDAIKFKKITIKPEELKTILNKSEIDFDPNQLDDIDDLALFRSERIDVGDNEYVFRTVMKDGVETTVRDVYKVNNDLLKLTLDHISPKQYHATFAAVKIAQWAKGLLTRMVTLDPGFFAGANALRDTFSAAILSNNPWHIPIISTIVKQIKRFANTKAIKMEDGSFMSTRELYSEFLLNGGSFGSTLLGGELSEGILKTLYRKMGHSDYSSNVLNTPKKLYDNYEKVVTGFENSSRFTEYSLMRQSINPATGVRFSAREAAYAAREVAVDFGMHGANNFFRQYVSTVPFLNAGLQGIYRTVRAVGPGSHQRAAVASKLVAYVGVPTAILYSLNRKNPEYWNQSQQIRDTNYLISLGKGKGWLKIPKPFEFGAFGTVAESLLAEGDSYLFKNDTAKADSFFDTLWVVMKDQLRLSYMPQVVSPVWNTYLNQTFFGSPIIPAGMKHTLPDYGQSYPWSSKVITSAIESAPSWLRNKLMSPIEFENYIRAYTGTIGGYALDLMDETSDLFSETKRPDKRFDEWPFFKRFLQLDPAKYTRAEAEFYELKNRAAKAINQFRKFKDEFKIELLEDFMKNPENVELMQLNARFEAWGRRISLINKQRNQIYNIKNMSGAKKRAQLDMLEKHAGKIFELIMNELEGKNLDVLDNTVFD